MSKPVFRVRHSEMVLMDHNPRTVRIELFADLTTVSVMGLPVIEAALAGFTGRLRAYGSVHTKVVVTPLDKPQPEEADNAV